MCDDYLRPCESSTSSRYFLHSKQRGCCWTVGKLFVCSLWKKGVFLWWCQSLFVLWCTGIVPFSILVSYPWTFHSVTTTSLFNLLLNIKFAFDKFITLLIWYSSSCPFNELSIYSGRLCIISLYKSNYPRTRLTVFHHARSFSYDSFGILLLAIRCLFMVTNFQYKLWNL